MCVCTSHDIPDTLPIVARTALHFDPEDHECDLKGGGFQAIIEQRCSGRLLRLLGVPL